MVLFKMHEVDTGDMAHAVVVFVVTVFTLCATYSTKVILGAVYQYAGFSKADSRWHELLFGYVCEHSCHSLQTICYLGFRCLQIVQCCS